MTIQEQLIRDEGERLKPYTDTVGKLTCGVGRNLTDSGISHEEAMYLLNNDINRCIASLTKKLPCFVRLSDVRQAVIVNMYFNMQDGLFGFHNFLAYLNNQDYIKASKEMLDSTWAKQVGERSQRLSKQMETNTWI